LAPRKLLNRPSSADAMPSYPLKTPYDELTYRIIGCAMAIHRRLGPGLREDTYQRALDVALTEAGLAFEPQKLLEVHDPDASGVLVGYYVPDFVVDSKAVVEIKALPGLGNSHIAQVIGYLTVSKCQVGLLLNFGAVSLQFRRILPPRAVEAHRINRQWLFVPDWLKSP
jgi:GxxExxY protein